MGANLNDDIPGRVSRILDEAISRGASDIHIEPTAQNSEIRYRVDGILLTADRVPAELGRGIVTRLMVLAQMLTYRLDVPQEGRARFTPGEKGDAVELRVSIMPTTHGMRAAVRLPAELSQPRSLETLGLSRPVLQGLQKFATADSGMLLLTGPAGSGKTTTIYALLEYIARTSPGLSIIALEDPVERDLPGVTQIEVSPFGELTYERTLRSVLRQDPQVLMLGEIRDAITAALAVQVALSGHRLISTLHAGTPGGAIARLIEMRIEPYQLTSAIFGVVSQRLLRRKANNGYRGRVPVAEFMPMNDQLRPAVLKRADASELQRIASEFDGYLDMRRAAQELAARGITDEPEIQRVLGTGL